MFQIGQLIRSGVEGAIALGARAYNGARNFAADYPNAARVAAAVAKAGIAATAAIIPESLYSGAISSGAARLISASISAAAIPGLAKIALADIGGGITSIVIPIAIAGAVTAAAAAFSQEFLVPSMFVVLTQTTAKLAAEIGGARGAAFTFPWSAVALTADGTGLFGTRVATTLAYLALQFAIEVATAPPTPPEDPLEGGEEPPAPPPLGVQIAAMAAPPELPVLPPAA